jgi:Fe-S-cluster containining protein
MAHACSQCGLCCRLFLINLSQKEYTSGKYKTQLEEFGLIHDFKKASSCGANILKQQSDGSCVYLKNKMCSIHAMRPQACKNFFCDSRNKKYKKMIEQIQAKQFHTTKHTY